MARPDPATLIGADHTALVIQEVQNGVIGDESSFVALAEAAASVGVIEKSVRLAGAARKVGVPVVHATAQNLPDGFGANRNALLFAAARSAGAHNAPGTRSVEPVPEFGDVSDDVVLPRFHGLSPMTGGPLDSLLRNSEITTLVVAGVSLNVAIPNLVFDAVNRGYQVVLAVDAVAGVPVEYGEQVVRHSLALLSTLMLTDEIEAAWA